MNIIEAIHDPNLFKPYFKDLRTWAAWLTLLKAFYGLEPDDQDLATYRKHTGRDKWPTRPARELWLICGRRSGKSFISALLGLYEACFKRHRLAVGEQGHVIIVAPTRYQARVIHGYLIGFLNANDMLRRMIVEERSFDVQLDNQTTVSILSSDYRSIRGYTAVAAIVDELAFFYSEGSRPDYETIRALRPALASTGGPLICLSTPYSKQGVLYNSFVQYYGRDADDVLVWRAASRDMNPTLDEAKVGRAVEDDPEGARAEWLGEFRDDISSYAAREAVEACVIQGRYELPPLSDVDYVAFCDPSGGGQDSMTLSIAHYDNDREMVIVDLIRECKPPFSPEAVVDEFALTLTRYRISSVTGDRYAGEWPREQFSKRGIGYDVSSSTKNQVYQSFLPLVNSGRVELLDHQRTINQLLNLERKAARGGRESIDHGPGGHDDLINAVAGASCLAMNERADLAGIHVFSPLPPADPWIEIAY